MYSGWNGEFLLLLVIFFCSPFCQDLYQSGFSYHMAISGKSFAALCDHFPGYLPKVLNWLQSQWNTLILTHNRTSKIVNIGDFSRHDFWVFAAALVGQNALSLQVLLRATVFARMTPDQKTQLVKELQKLKWVLGIKGKGGQPLALKKERSMLPMHAVPSRLLSILNLM